jgi:hypothetical protein
MKLILFELMLLPNTLFSQVEVSKQGFSEVMEVINGVNTHLNSNFETLKF